ncbi:carboxymuconolactone decarboxylase family protein [Falsigemmobacter faecalis]|uniref:Carboxymuconolactone decarboxylase family protein n=1 Tax=Falsigemmobacter faecalis TaxID=2488730 RepID=A0A3P3DHA5_9RHOB|nr:carboxymuconolactone decarboxylase family protein [Falsigemmobacter faecalis]RRH73204.1 carboxymuconolactone decarboxylase family protein [Falsigemmobacter faecalis]
MLNPLSDPDWPDEIADLREGFAGRLNVYRTMAHHPDLLRAWSSFRNHCVLGTALTPAQSEVVILRCGLRLRSDYEWQHHIIRGRKAGLSDARILSLCGALSGMAAEDAVLAAAVDELFTDSRLTQPLYDRVVALAGQKGLLDVMATVAHYTLLGFILNSFGVPLDEDIAAALRDAPLDGARPADGQ